MVRINVFVTAYFQYRDSLTKQLGPGHQVDQEAYRKQEEATLIKCFEEFESKLPAI